MEAIALVYQTGESQRRVPDPLPEVLSFSFEARRMRSDLERLLVSADSATELRRSDWSWLSDLRFRGAEPAERRFNRIFLGIRRCSSADAFRLKSTATACSKDQFGRPDEFSCPSDARIALTWVLGAILVATGFASRFVLHRRIRRLYIPLALVVVAIGVAAVWLITHHPRWGVPR